MYKTIKTSILGNPLSKEPTTIVGAGISGLLLGYFLKKNGVPIKIIEKADKAGGILGSKVCENGIAETAANGFLWSAALVEICEDLKLDLIYPNKIQKARYLVRNRKLTKFPLGIFNAMSGFGNALFPKSKKVKTLREFGETYLNQNFTDYLLEPAFGGIYGALAEELSFEACMPSLAEILNNNKSLVLGGISAAMKTQKNPNKIGGTISFKNGMQELVDALANHLKDEIQYGHSFEQKAIDNGNVVFCIPAYAAKKYFDGPLFDLLNEVSYSSMISICSFIDKTALSRFKPGFGCLISRKENLQSLGVLFNSCIFENRVKNAKQLSLTTILRDFDGALSQMDDFAIKELVNKELDILFEMEKAPIEQHVFRWEKGIPMYSPNLFESWFEMDELLKKSFPNIRLFGNYTGNISIRKMADEAGAIFS